jgi:hypothetical protein
MPRGLRSCTSCAVQFGRYRCDNCDTNSIANRHNEQHLHRVDIQQHELQDLSLSDLALSLNDYKDINEGMHIAEAMCLECWHAHQSVSGHQTMIELLEHVHRT